MSFTSNPGTYFRSNGHSYGTCEVKEKEAKLSVLSETLELNQFSLEGVGTKKMNLQIIN